MYICWRTSHYINERVITDFHTGAKDGNVALKDIKQFNQINEEGRLLPSISYGILRGTGEIFKHCREKGLDFWEIDRGYFKPDHFKGYYRISKNNTRATYRPDCVTSDRWDALKIPVAPMRENDKGSILLVPPTGYVAEYFGIDADQWVAETTHKLQQYCDRHVKIRDKQSMIPLDIDLAHSYCVVTYNSNVALDALLYGIKVIAPDCPDIYSWNQMGLENINDPYDFDRVELFSYLACCQFTLDEFRNGTAWTMTRVLQ